MADVGPYNFRPMREGETTEATTMVFAGIDLTGKSASFEVYNTTGDLLLTLTPGSGLTMAGQSITIEPFTLSEVGTNRYWLNIIDGAENQPYMTGTIRVQRR